MKNNNMTTKNENRLLWPDNGENQQTNNPLPAVESHEDDTSAREHSTGRPGRCKLYDRE